ncbi:MAG TPA: hypothetical protein VFF09_03040 [archaeon]|nr:hypothetical protein [archaeon]
MDKRQILKDSVKRLLELNISDREILENLKSVGVAEAESRQILKEVKDSLGGKKGVGRGAEEPVKTASKEYEAPEEELPDDEDIYSKVYDELEEGADLGTTAAAAPKPIKNPSYSSPPSSSSMAELWEKGIMATVDSKLGEMQKIRSDLDSYIEQKIRERVQAEVKKIQTVLDSQKTLYTSRIDAHLESKSDEVRKVVESKARQMEDLYAKVQQEVLKVQAEKKFSAELLNTITDKTTQLDTIKSQMISETNSSLIEMESKFSDFMEESKQKRSEMEERINRALQLESKITEGLLEDAKQRIDRLAVDKQGELSSQIQKKMRELDEMTRQVDPKGINERLARLKELEQELVKRQKDIDKEIDSRFAELGKDFLAFKKQVAKIEDDNIVELRKLYSADVDDLFAEHLTDWDKKLKEKKKDIAELEKQLDVGKFNATMESLDLFKDQFVNTIRKNIGDYNKTKTELAESIIQRDKSINDYLKKIDGKMQELSQFEKQFSRDVASLLDKVPEEKMQKKQPKGKKNP